MTSLKNKPSSFDRITISRLKLEALIGIYSHEQQFRQPVYITLNLYIKPLLPQSRLEDSVDYFNVSESVKQLVQSKSFDLIENMSFEILTLLFNQFSLIEAIEIYIEKPQAIHNADFAGISLFRERA